MSTLVVTGSSGLIGSEAVEHFDRLGWQVHGLDNDIFEEMARAYRDKQ